MSVIKKNIKFYSEDYDHPSFFLIYLLGFKEITQEPPDCELVGLNSPALALIINGVVSKNSCREHVPWCPVLIPEGLM